MNNDLEQFSEDFLNEMIVGGLSAEPSSREVSALARIALAAKQAKAIGYVESKTTGTGRFILKGFYEQNINIGDSLYTTPQPAHTERVIPDGWIKFQEQKPIANQYISFVSRHGEYASGLVGEDEWVEMHDGTSFALDEIYTWLLLPPLPAAPKPESE